MRAIAAVDDVSRTPSVTFGSRTMMWWATLGFIVIEGWSVALLIASYIYLRQNYVAWPPLGTPLPSLGIPTLNVLIMLASIVPAALAARAARRLDTPAVKAWLVITSIMALAVVVLRWWELWALNTRWDSNAYGSAAWTVVGFHASLLLLDVCDTIGLTLLYFLRPLPMKAYSDVNDNTFYWYFTIAIWIPVYLIVYVGPRLA